MADTRGELACSELVESVESNCPFCDIKQFEERLIAEVGGFYIIATLGQITDGGYVLIFPKEHIPCMGALTEDQAVAMYEIRQQIMIALALEYGLTQTQIQGNFMPLTIFEHGVVGQTVKHAHLHLLPTVCNLMPRIKKDFPDSVIEELEYSRDLLCLYKNRPYLYWAVGNENE